MVMLLIFDDLLFPKVLRWSLGSVSYARSRGMMRRVQAIYCSWRVSFVVIFFSGRPLSSDEHSSHRSWRFPPGRRLSAGGKQSKRRIPPTTAAAPEFGRPQRILLRPAFALRSWAIWRNAVLRRAPTHRRGACHAQHPRVYYKRFCFSSFHLFSTKRT